MVDLKYNTGGAMLQLQNLDAYGTIRTRYVRRTEPPASIYLQTVCCYMPHDRQRGEDLCSVYERENPGCQAGQCQRTSCEVGIRLVNC